MVVSTRWMASGSWERSEGGASAVPALSRAAQSLTRFSLPPARFGRVWCCAGESLALVTAPAVVGSKFDSFNTVALTPMCRTPR